jgi:ABC-type polar amino acid transport system ATPase subunit
MMDKRPDEPETPRAETAVEIIALNKWFGEFHVLRDIDLKVARGERIVICGPSGSGKSTLLRCINHLEDWQSGRIVVGMNPNIMLFDEPTSALDPEMVKEVLDTMVELASDRITMLVVSHEMGFARQVADRMIFMADGQILEINEPKGFFDHPQHERTRLFLQQILR